MPTDSKLYDKLETYIAGVRPEFEELLAGLVEVPTVSMDPERKGDIQRGADVAVECLKRIGASAERVETPGNPVVFGKLEADSRFPTVIVYNHMDVQPAQEPEWRREPFVFGREDGRYLGRGTTDDKGPALAVLLAARYAREQGIPLNIRFIWELEEEIGSPNFEHFVLNRLNDLQTDSVLVSDTIWISREKPAIPYGLRGLQGARLILETGEKDAHSGLTGGAARNPIGELCQLISECYDARSGKVKIPGFYRDVVKVSAKELKSFLASGFNVNRWMKAHGLKSLRTRDRKGVLQRIWCQPTFEVHGMVGGYTGPGVKTVVPPRAEVKVTMRLIPNQRPMRVFRLLKDFVRRKNRDVRVEPGGSLAPYLGDFSGPYADAARTAMKYAFGQEPAFIREGGSIGAVVTMQKHLKAPIMFIGLSLPEHGYHAPNENFDWGQASGGIKA
ncbi:MAG: M20/M25/M40 family metallo-hydrolase, partial [Acidobacteria bacterium]|nr:M20/M25/M40 family metallo-hydrolase [Acidobacteriota bacterium]